MGKTFITSLLLSSLLLTSSVVQARIYQYTDNNGRKVFVDRFEKVPQKYRSQLAVHDEERETLTPAQTAKIEADRASLNLKLRLDQQKAQIKEAMSKWITDFSFYQNRIVIPVKVRYGGQSKTLSLVMDTGASYTVVHQAAIADLNAQLLPGGSAQVADGSVVQTSKINFDQVDIGPYKSQNIVASVIDFKGGGGSSHGLLGMDFLYNAHYELDRENQKIIWEPEKYEELKQQLLDLKTLEEEMNAPTVSAQ